MLDRTVSVEDREVLSKRRQNLNTSLLTDFSKKSSASKVKLTIPKIFRQRKPQPESKMKAKDNGAKK